ncbi:hypothetical protein L484_027102 [Morus notabilis]|uniref:Uncharacterized protein n=1 Tax=Morus notabilis TaxID=981085 RepID=W9SBJ1_9ROSA|nr:hypothetical protein L484_027102 [Morus notabilis]
MRPRNARLLSANPRSQATQNITAAGTSTDPLPPAAENPPDRIDQLQNQVKTLAATVERMATALAGRDQGQNPMPPLEDTPMNPVNAAVRGQGIGDQRGDAEEVGDSRANDPRPTKSNRSVGSRQRAARRRVREKAAA